MTTANDFVHSHAYDWWEMYTGEEYVVYDQAHLNEISVEEYTKLFKTMRALMYKYIRSIRVGNIYIIIYKRGTER